MPRVRRRAAAAATLLVLALAGAVAAAPATLRFRTLLGDYTLAFDTAVIGEEAMRALAPLSPHLHGWESWLVAPPRERCVRAERSRDPRARRAAARDAPAPARPARAGARRRVRAPLARVEPLARADEARVLPDVGRRRAAPPVRGARPRRAVRGGARGARARPGARGEVPARHLPMAQLRERRLPAPPR